VGQNTALQRFKPAEAGKAAHAAVILAELI
jgi:hypothetical protein